MALHQLSQRRGLAQESCHGPGSGQKWDNREWWGRSLRLRAGQGAPQEDVLGEILSNLSLLMARKKKKVDSTMACMGRENLASEMGVQTWPYRTKPDQLGFLTWAKQKSKEDMLQGRSRFRRVKMLTEGIIWFWPARKLDQRRVQVKGASLGVEVS